METVELKDINSIEKLESLGYREVQAIERLQQEMGLHQQNIHGINARIQHLRETEGTAEPQENK